MSDIFREVDEDLRRDEAAKVWKKYGPYAIALPRLLRGAAGGSRRAPLDRATHGGNLRLRRLDESKTTAVAGARRELFEAMCLVAETGRGPEAQISSMGCSIKWRVP